MRRRRCTSLSCKLSPCPLDFHCRTASCNRTQVRARQHGFIDEYQSAVEEFLAYGSVLLRLAVVNLRTVIVTAAVYWGFDQELAPHHLTFQHRAGVTPYTSTFVFAECCVFNKQSQPPILCGPVALQVFLLSRYWGTPSSEVTVSICRVPSPEFSQAPEHIQLAHQCRFSVRSYQAEA